MQINGLFGRVLFGEAKAEVLEQLYQSKHEAKLTDTEYQLLRACIEDNLAVPALLLAKAHAFLAAVDSRVPELEKLYKEDPTFKTAQGHRNTLARLLGKS